jgi:hypothetical protein
MDKGGLAVDWRGSTNFAPIDVANALMPQTHPEYGDFSTKVLHCFIRDTCF